MACYNTASYIEEAILSILNQSMNDFDFIIVDDASSDSTPEIVNYYKNIDHRIVYHAHKKNMGPAIARNTGIQLAQGKWIAILDADDVALPERLEQQLAHIENQPDIVLVGSDCISINDSGNTIKYHYYPVDHYRLVRHLEKYMAFPQHSSFLYRSDMLKRVGGFNTRFVPSEDCDLWIRLAEIGKMASVNKPLVKIRKHSLSISRHDGGKTQTIHAIATIVCHFLRIKGIDDPSSLNDTEWYRFIDWLTHRIEQSGIFKRDTEKWKLRDQFYLSDKKARATLQLLYEILSSGNNIQMVVEKLFGKNIAREASKEWVKHAPQH